MSESESDIWWKVAFKNLRAAILPGQQIDNEPSWFRFIPITAGSLAAIAGILTVKATYLANDAIYSSNQAILAQVKASDSWAEFQANSIKARILETAIVTNPETSAALADKQEEYRIKQISLNATAKNNQAATENFLNAGKKKLGQRDMLTYDGVSVQLAIVIASLAAMTKRYSLFLFTLVITIFSLLLTAWTFAAIFLNR